MKNVLIPICFLAFLAGCSVSNKNDLDKDLKVFLTDFSNKLSQPDEVIWKQFMTLQNREEIFKVIRVLQNKESKYITTKIITDDLLTRWDEGMLVVNFPIYFYKDGSYVDRDHLLIKLIRKNDKYFIVQMQGEDFYFGFNRVKYQVEENANMDIQKARMKFYYDRAIELQKKCDSVIWFVNYKNNTFYYAVNGTYNFDSLVKTNQGDFKMGLLDSLGNTIVPFEYDLIGTPGIALDDHIEVKKGGKIGYYNLKGEMVLPVEYDWLVPEKEENSVAIVKKDSVYGWLDKDFNFTPGFLTERSERKIKNLEYLTENRFSIGNGHQSIITKVFPPIDGYLYQSSGLIVPTNYFVTQGIFSPIESGYITANSDSYQMGNLEVENSNSKLYSITDKIYAFVADFKNRFVGGRSEFYTTHKIFFLDETKKVITSVDAYGDDDFKFRKINESLFESSYLAQNMGPNDLYEQNFPDYNYYSFDGTTLKSLKSNRRFPFTQFLKVDSSYLSGKFVTWSEAKGQGNSDFVSVETTQMIRDEILASYGFVFPEGYPNSYSHYEWYRAYTSSYDEVYKIASDIDKYNLDFLTRIIGSKPWSKPA
jgi:hypothetical protein